MSSGRAIIRQGKEKDGGICSGKENMADQNTEKRSRNEQKAGCKVVFISGKEGWATCKVKYVTIIEK